MTLFAESDQHLHREPGDRRRAHVPLRGALHAPPLLHGRVGLRGRPLQDIPLLAGNGATVSSLSLWWTMDAHMIAADTAT